MIGLRRVLCAWLLATCLSACRYEGLVGEGSACPERCAVDERCVSGACLPLRTGAAGDDSDRFDEGELDGDGDHDDEGPGDGPPRDDSFGEGDGLPDDH